jgi:predicted kinase
VTGPVPGSRGRAHPGPQAGGGPVPGPTDADRVVLLCGPAGSGKSTLAHRLGAEGRTVLSFDAEAWRRGHHEHPVAADVAAEIHALLQRRTVALVAEGARVVLDSAFWSRASRDAYRVALRPHGIEPVVYHLATPADVVLARLAARRGTGPHDVVVPPERARAYLDGFEVPTADEGPVRTFPGVDA